MKTMLVMLAKQISKHTLYSRLQDAICNEHNTVLC